MNVTSALPPTENITNSDDVHILTTYVMRYISFLIGAVGLTGNTFVVVVIMSASKMRKQLTNAYIINQSVIDGTISLFLILTTIFEDDGRKYHTLGDEIFCKLWLTKIWLWGFFVTSSYNLLALTLERYLAVVHPIWHKLKMTKNKVAVSIVFVWFFGPVYNLAYMIPTAGITETGYCTVYSIWPNSLSQHAVGVLTIFIQFFGPLFMLVFFYTRMIIVLRRRVAPEGSSNSNRESGGGTVQVRKSDSMARARKNILKTLAMVAFSFVFCWTWNQIYYLMFNLGLMTGDFTSVFYNFTVVMVFLNCCINPFIYIAKYEQFQKTMKMLFCNKETNVEETQLCNSSVE
ncbi:hypothetical protein LSH36_259g01016 [Paralvinella palmiformis]|uniref:G-protein coupled receptors family 1 profile domain-containing protein n=1 Tax=Paralvinella palmiformis TaxID=53620 RepID=A0AAD9N4H5_9ANNE|nr:hypothetical protein LSH36_259g01016 [Paralvinella palmiformis]